MQTADSRGSAPRRINLKVPDALHHHLKLQAVKERVTLQDLVTRWLQEKLAERERHETGLMSPMLTLEERRQRVEAAVGSM